MIWSACKAKAAWAWRHRTKTLGGIGLACGGLEGSLQSHPDIHLPGRGVLLMVFGAMVMIVGTYNSVAQFFGWTDQPDPPRGA
jgi:hypothetical protein